MAVTCSSQPAFVSIEFRQSIAHILQRPETRAMDGIFIVLDGIDGAGKTTQVQLLGDALEAAGETVVRSKEPTNGQWGRVLRESAASGRMDLASELQHFTEDRREHVETVIAPALAAGKIVIVDRYFYSTVAYQGARGAKPMDVARDMRSMFPIPDVAVLLDADPALTLARIETGRGETPNHFERLDQLQSVREIFLGMAALREIKFVDASQGIEGVYRQIVNVLVEGVLKQKRCFKAYDCDVFYCAPRALGDCRWANIVPSLQGKIPAVKPPGA